MARRCSGRETEAAWKKKGKERKDNVKCQGKERYEMEYYVRYSVDSTVYQKSRRMG